MGRRLIHPLPDLSQEWVLGHPPQQYTTLAGIEPGLLRFSADGLTRPLALVAEWLGQQHEHPRSGFCCDGN